MNPHNHASNKNKVVNLLNVKNLKRYVIGAVIIGLLGAGVVLASVLNSRQLAPSPSNTNCLTSDGNNNIWSSSCGSGGGSASASAPSLSVQYNNGSGNLLGSANLLFTNSATILNLNGTLKATSSVFTNATTSALAITGITNSYLAVNQNGSVISTTTPILTNTTLIAGGTATGPAITFATSTDTNLLLQIVCGVATCTFTPQWTGTLADGRISSASTWNGKLGSYNVVSANGLISVATSTTLATLTASTSPTFTNLTTTGATILATLGGNVGIGTTTPNAPLTVYGNLSVATSSTPALFVNTATGMVGIGTASPGYTLDVNGGLQANATSTFTGAVSVTNGGGNAAALTVSSGSIAQPTLSLSNNVNANAISISKTTGNNNALNITETNVQDSAILVSETTVTAARNAGVVGMDFTLNDSLQPTFASSYVHAGIRGIMNQTATLNYPLPAYGVYAKSTANDPLATAIGLYASGSSASGTAYGIYSAAGTNYFSGNVGIGTTTPGYGFVNVGTAQLKNLTTSAGLQTAVMCLDANAQVISDSVACLASAARYKQNITPLNLSLNELMALQPISFLYKPDFNGSYQKDPNLNSTQYSLVADQVQKIDPRLTTVTTQKTTFEGKTYPAGTVQGLQGLNTWIGAFVNWLQQIEKQIVDIQLKQNTDEAKIQAQQKQIDTLQRQVNLLLQLKK